MKATSDTFSILKSSEASLDVLPPICCNCFVRLIAFKGRLNCKSPKSSRNSALDTFVADEINDWIGRLTSAPASVVGIRTDTLGTVTLLFDLINEYDAASLFASTT